MNISTFEMTNCHHGSSDWFKRNCSINFWIITLPSCTQSTPLNRSSSGEAYLSQEHLVDFLNKEQRDPRLNELLHPRCTADWALTIINKYEPDVALSAEGLQLTNAWLIDNWQIDDSLIGYSING